MQKLSWKEKRTLKRFQSNNELKKEYFENM